MNSPQALAAAIRKLRSEPDPELPLGTTLRGNIDPPRRMNPILKFVLIILGIIIAGFMVALWTALFGQ
jgi:hypothetical protein